MKAQQSLQVPISIPSELFDLPISSLGFIADNIDLKLVLGKQFTKKIYVNTQLDINDFQNSKYQATYRLNKKTSIVGGIDVENKWHFRYRYKFYY